MEANSQSASKLVTGLLGGPTVRGAVFSRHELRFGDYILMLTPPGSPRMPNGIECPVTAAARARVSIGGGRLQVGRLQITPGPPWNPVPSYEPGPSLRPGIEPLAEAMRSWADSADPAAGPLLAGYVAGLVLLHGQHARAEQVALRAIPRVGPAAATLLRHAALGEVPEPVHDLLATGNPYHLISFSASGIAWLRGLVSAGLQLDVGTPGHSRARQTA